MDEKEIETMIAECKNGASDNCFNLDQGHIKVINYKRYADLLEHVIRTKLSKRNE
jgi:hypothetical protein